MTDPRGLEANRQIVRDYFRGVDGRGTAVFDELCSPDLAVHLFGLWGQLGADLPGA